jgi:hypothetical protein
MLETWIALNSGGWGVFIAPTTKTAVGEGYCRWAHQTVWCVTGHCPVHQPHHPTVRVLTVSTVGALTSWGTGQSVPHRTGTVHYPVRLLALLWLSTHYSAFAGVRWSGPLRWSRCSAGTPDSPVNYSGVALQKPEGEEFSLYGPWGTGHCPVCQTWVLFGFFCSFVWTLTWTFLLVCVEPLAPVEHII